MRTIILIFAFLTTILAANHPIIFVHGVLGSALEMKHTGHAEPLACAALKRDHWRQFWIDPTSLSILSKCISATISVNCAVEGHDSAGAPLCVNKETKAFVRPVSYPTLDAVRRIDDLGSNILKVNYFTGAENVLKEFGWTAEKNLFAFSYDFRMTPSGLRQTNHAFDGTPYAGTDFDRLKAMVEHARALNNGQKVIFLTHSAGAQLVHEFLGDMGAGWVDSNVHNTIHVAPSVAGTLDGTAQAIMSQNYGIIPARYIGYITQGTWPVFPYVGLDNEWFEDFVNVIHIINKSENIDTYYNNSNISDAISYFHDAHTANVYKDVLTYRSKAMAKNTVGNTLVLAGKGRRTADQIEYEFVNNKWVSRETAHQDGDGTVPLAPLKRWCEHNKSPEFSWAEVKGGVHMDYISNEKLFRSQVMTHIQTIDNRL